MNTPDARQIRFIVREEATNGRYLARAYWAEGDRHIVTQAADRAELVRKVREAVGATFGANEAKPNSIHLHYVRDEVIATR